MSSVHALRPPKRHASVRPSWAIRPVALTGFLLLTLALAPACPQETIPPDNLVLEITSETPVGGGRIESLRIIVTDDDGNRLPAVIADPAFNYNLGQNQDPTADPVFIGIRFEGTSFAATAATLQVTGRIGNKAVAIFQGAAQLDAKSVLKVPLMAIGDACDSDSDGFLDCATDGCCPQGGLEVSDCEPTSTTSNPYGVEDACEPCDDNFDNDCKGGDIPCLDQDDDGSPDCADCEPNNGDVYPGAVELCGGGDQNCDPSDDDAFTHNGAALGAACGLGACAGGLVICNADEPLEATCSSLSSQGAQEICDDGIDNDCDGVLNEGCGDIDGDGVPSTGDNPDCKDLDASIYPGAPEPCCVAGVDIAVCDKNCDGATTPCSIDDLDGDGFVEPADCREGDPLTYPGAQEKCDDDIDQDCFGGDVACSTVVDEDGDKWPPFGTDGAPLDCDDSNPNINPEAIELCNGIDDNCNGVIDEGNPLPADPSSVSIDGNIPFTSMGAVCGSDEGTCVSGIFACANNDAFTGQVICAGTVLPADEWCDSLDNDCDGVTDNGNLWDPAGGAAAIGDDCVGYGSCGSGVVHCACPVLADLTVDENCGPGARVATCSTQPNGIDPQSTIEVCDANDNDCDNDLNEALTNYADSTCRKAGVCAAVDDVFPASAVCNTNVDGGWACTYDSTAIQGYESGECPAGSPAGGCSGCGSDNDCEQTCDGLDNNCDGQIDENFLINNGCDGPDEDLCANGTIVCSADGLSSECNEVAGESKPEICDGLDNDCDGLTDEDFILLGTKCDSDDLDQCENGTYSCALDGSGETCLVSSETVTDIEDVCDGEDNDCDGSTDEDYPINQACDSNDSDNCANSFRTCTSDGMGTECLLSNESIANIPDLCDGTDEDCDGATDEDFEGDKGIACDGNDSDVCLNGFRTCAASGLVTECVNETQTDIIDVCNGFDDDCDGDADEDYDVGVSCDSNDSDFCLNGVKQCNGAENGTVCVESINFEEICNGSDDDCDGSTDEDWNLSGALLPADNGRVFGQTCGAGECSGGAVVCNGAASVVCDSNSKAQPEMCNGIDDDCDGQTDETINNCNDGLTCTTDTCSGSCSNTINAGSCVINNTCYSHGDLNPSNPCQRCNSNNPTGWSNMPNTTSCNADNDGCTQNDTCSGGTCQAGSTVTCNDSKSCTTDVCTSTGNNSRTCTNPVNAGNCLINGTCRTVNTTNPSNECQHCTGASTTAWSNKSNSTSCDADGNGCTQNDTCSNGSCQAGPPPNCDDGRSCTTDTCVSDGVNDHTCTHPVVAGNCFISNTCYTTGTENPTNDCEVCTSATSTDDWSNKSGGTECGDDSNTTCTNPDTCNGSGICQQNHASGLTLCGDSPAPGSCEAQATCSNGSCGALGDAPFGTLCGSGTVTTCTAADTCDAVGNCQDNNVSNGTTCSDGDGCTVGDSCMAGSCSSGGGAACDDSKPCTTDSCTNNSGTADCTNTINPMTCLIGGDCYDATVPDLNPGNDCQACLAADDDDWSDLPDMTACSGGTCDGAGACTP